MVQFVPDCVTQDPQGLPTGAWRVQAQRPAGGSRGEGTLRATPGTLVSPLYRQGWPGPAGPGNWPEVTQGQTCGHGVATAPELSSALAPCPALPCPVLVSVLLVPWPHLSPLEPLPSSLLWSPSLLTHISPCLSASLSLSLHLSLWSLSLFLYLFLYLCVFLSLYLSLSLTVSV